MTCDERLEKLLNKAGQTISDLPKSDGMHLTYDREQRSSAEHEVFAFAHQTGYVDVIDCLAMHQDYILHLTDVIDRMEWALDKTVRERDYLEKRFGDAVCDCDICVNAENDPDYSPYMICDLSEKHFEFAGIPEDWRADDV